MVRILQAVGKQVVARGEMQNLCAKAADGAFLDGDQNFMLADELPDERFIERLGKPGVRHRD